MAGSAEMLAAFRELTTTKQLDRSDLLELLRDGIHAALARKFGANVRFDLDVDELQGSVRVMRLRTVVESVEDSSGQVSLEEARFESVVDAICSELGVPQSDPAPPAAPR